MPPLSEHACDPGGIGVERRLPTAIVAVPGEGSAGSGVEALRIRARTSGTMARAMPVIDYFYTQLGPGRFEIASDVRLLDDAILSRTAIEPLSVGAVVPDPAWIAFVLPLRWSGQYLFNGAEVTPRSLGVCADLKGYYTRGTSRDGIAVGLQRSRFTTALAALRGVPEDEIRLPNGLLQLPAPTIANLRQRLCSMSSRRAQVQSAAKPGIAAEGIYELLLDAYLAAESGSARESRRGLRWAEIVRRAEERFVAASGRSVSLADLCAAAGVGRTALQQAFLGMYGESPLAYFHKRRLMQAHETLVSGPPGRSAVKRAALGAGLHALGRFSVEYRLLFGERPSAMLGRLSA